MHYNISNNDTFGDLCDRLSVLRHFTHRSDAAENLPDSLCSIALPHGNVHTRILWQGQYEDYGCHVQLDQQQDQTECVTEKVDTNTSTAAVIRFEKHQSSHRSFVANMIAGKALDERRMYVDITAGSACSIRYHIQGTAGTLDGLNINLPNSPHIVLRGTCWTSASLSLPVGWSVYSAAGTGALVCDPHIMQSFGMTSTSINEQSEAESWCVLQPFQSIRRVDKLLHQNSYVAIIKALLLNDRSVFVSSQVDNVCSSFFPLIYCLRA